MIVINKIETNGWEAAIRGMRNPMNSWDKSDSSKNGCNFVPYCVLSTRHNVGPNDLKLMLSLSKSGSDHAKFRRFITVTMDILAPLYWWKEFDTYKVGTVANSCSTMHKITEKEFTLEDFSHEHLNTCILESAGRSPSLMLEETIDALNDCRTMYNSFKTLGDVQAAKRWWWQMIQLLPSSYNQKRTVQLNYEVLASIYDARKDHKLDEWRELCKIIEKLPYSEIITLKEDEN